MSDPTDQKPIVELRDWTRIGNHLSGHVTGHPNPDLPDGMYVRTSTILNEDTDNGLVETRNTLYRLIDKEEEA